MDGLRDSIVNDDSDSKGMLIGPLGKVVSKNIPEDLKRDASEMVLALAKPKVESKVPNQNGRRKRRSTGQPTQIVEEKTPEQVMQK